eukprot:UN08274
MDHMEDAISEYAGMGRTYRAIFKARQKRRGSRSIYVFPEIVKHSSTFHHSLKDLLLLTPDQYLNQNVFINYFNDPSCVFQARLTCISQSGQYRLENIVYRGDSWYKTNKLGTLSYNYWFHMNCTTRIYVDNCHCTALKCQCHVGLEYTKHDLTPILT